MPVQTCILESWVVEYACLSSAQYWLSTYAFLVITLADKHMRSVSAKDKAAHRKKGL